VIERLEVSSNIGSDVVARFTSPTGKMRNLFD
jgi:hypothetical protein